MNGTVALAAFCAALLAFPAQSKDLTDMPVGTKVKNYVEMGKVQIPLPKGEWELSLVHTRRSQRAGKIGTVFLTQDSGESGFVGALLDSNLDSCASVRRWKRVCDRRNTHFNKSDRNYNVKDQACWDVNHQTINPKKKTKNKFYRKLYKFMRQRNMKPETYIINSFLISGQCRFVRLRYSSNPVDFGFPPELKRWKDSAWHSDVVDAERRRKRFVVANWSAGKRLRDAVDRGFDGKLGGWTSDIAIKFK